MKIFFHGLQSYKRLEMIHLPQLNKFHFVGFVFHFHMYKAPQKSKKIEAAVNATASRILDLHGLGVFKTSCHQIPTRSPCHVLHGTFQFRLREKRDCFKTRRKRSILVYHRTWYIILVYKIHLGISSCPLNTVFYGQRKHLIFTEFEHQQNCISHLSPPSSVDMQSSSCKP